jgi:hypothetical protein
MTREILGEGEPSAEAGLRLEIGKCYVDREGEVYGPMFATKRTSPYRKTHPFTDPETGMSFTADGRYYSAASPNEMDLVAEDPSPAAPAPALGDKDELIAALRGILKRYVDFVLSGDGGNWDPEEEAEVIAARAALAKVEGK